MTRPIYKQKKIIIPLVLILLLGVIRLISPSIILKQINDELAEASPTIRLHVKDLDLALIWGTYRLRGMTASIKETDNEFLKISNIEVYADWRSIFTGTPVVALTVYGIDFTYSDDVMEAIQTHLERKKPPEEPPDIFHLSRVDVNDTTIRLAMYEDLTRDKGVIISGLEGRVTNLTPSDVVPKSLFSFQGTLIGSGLVKTVGELELLEDPAQWSVNGEILKFELPVLNEFLYERVPLTFTRGKLDFYSEAKSVNGVITGYFKPFVNNLIVMRGTENYKSIRHWVIELITAIGSMATSSDDVSATRVNFKFDEELKTDTGEVLTKAFRHSFVQELSRGIENSVHL